jgi:hypothetical protein
MATSTQPEGKPKKDHRKGPTKMQENTGNAHKKSTTGINHKITYVSNHHSSEKKSKIL